MVRIKAGTAVAFSRPIRGITPSCPYAVRHCDNSGIYIVDDEGAVRRELVQDRVIFGYVGGSVLSTEHDTRTALIEALKARLEAVKDATLGAPENSEQFWVMQTLENAYGIKAQIAPGPSTVTFTELADNT